MILKKNILVVSYSRTGKTKFVSYKVSKKLGADYLELSDGNSRKGFFGLLKSLFEVIQKKTPVLNEFEINPSSYDLVIVASPVWGGTMSSLTRSFLCSWGKLIKKIAFIVTSDGSEPQNFLDESISFSKKPVAFLQVSKNDFKDPSIIDSKIANFLKLV